MKVLTISALFNLQFFRGISLLVMKLVEYTTHTPLDILIVLEVSLNSAATEIDKMAK